MTCELRSLIERLRVSPGGLQRAGLLFLIAGSAITIPLAEMWGITLTGDRLLGLAAIAVAALLAISGGLRWTPIHTALALFVVVQIACSLLNVGAWLPGLKLVTVYVLGFACFALTASWAASPATQRWAVRAWIAVGASVGLLGAAAGIVANLAQAQVWGAGLVQSTITPFSGDILLFAGRATFAEWNFLGSFLLIPFSLTLWGWERQGPWDRRSWIGLGVLGAIVAGLVFSVTRSAWLGMASLVAVWWWVRRPRLTRLSALAALMALAFITQAAVVRSSKAPVVATAPAPAVMPGSTPRSGWWTSSPVAFRIIEPLKRGYDWNIAGRVSISRVTLQSWRERPLVGHGAGSTNRLSVVLDTGTPLTKVWNGNVFLFVLHDSGMLGLGTLIVLISVVARQGWRWARSSADAASVSAAPLLATGAALLFCYQFTHGLWIMYPYVYLGLLTAALRQPPRQADASKEHAPV